MVPVDPAGPHVGKTYGRLMDRGAVHYARTDGSMIREAIYPIMTPNGVGLSPVRGGVSVFSPQGERVEFHEADEVYCTNICFGGADMCTAFIKLSGTGRLIAVEWPRPGPALNDPRTARKG